MMYADPLPLCTGVKDVKYKYCQQNYSVMTLKQELNDFVKQAYEGRQVLDVKYNINDANRTLVPQA